MFGLCSSVLLSFVFLAIVQADYNIDDTNATIQYTGTASPEGLWLPLNLTNGNGVINGNGSLLVIDYGRLFNQTATFTRCNGTQLCQIGIPFRGSGITVYGIVLGTLNFTVAIDENPAPPPDLTPPPLNTAPLIYNTSLYNIQSLPFAFHFLTLTLVGWITGDPRYPKAESLILFDYVHVNDTLSFPDSISTTSSTVAASSSASSHSNPPKTSHSTIGIAVGSTVGAIAVCAVVVFGLMRRHNTRAVTIQPISFVAEREPIEPLRPAALNPAQAIMPSNTNVLIPSMILASPRENGLGGIQRDPVTSGTFPDRPTTSATGARLTEEQTEFVHSLYSLSVPAPAIALVIQRIMAETPDTSGPTSPVETQRSDLGAITAPPSYNTA